MDLQKLKTFVLEGDAEGVVEEIKAALAENVSAETLLDDALIPAMDEIGRLFEEGEAFVPEMLIAARAMQAGMVELKPLLAETGKEPIGKAAIGTVQGDLHDIGKNLVALMLEGAGFEVFDLGTDVKPDQFIQAVKDGVQIVGMSALLTTTMPAIQTSIQALEEAGVRQQVKVIIGGAPVTQDYADEVGADGYAADAASAVRVSKRVIGIM